MHAPWDRARRMRVGLLVLGSAALFVGLLVVTIGVGLSTKDVLYYLRLEENVKGLVIGSRVNFQGVPVGAVSDIVFENGLTSVELSCDPARAPIQDVTRARLDRALVTGQVTVELEGYSSTAKALEPGALIQPRPSALTALTEALPDVASDVGAVVAEVQRLAANLNTHLEGPLPGELRATLGDLRAVLAEAKDAVAVIQRSAERFEQLEDEGLALLNDTRGVIGVARGPLLALLDTTREALEEVRLLARQISAAPSSLIFGGTAAELVPGAPR